MNLGSLNKTLYRSDPVCSVDMCKTVFVWVGFFLWVCLSVYLSLCVNRYLFQQFFSCQPLITSYSTSLSTLLSAATTSKGNQGKIKQL